MEGSRALVSKGSSGMNDNNEENVPVSRCLCGAEPIVEQKEGGYTRLFKYSCPNCKEKELPYLGQWRDCGALQEWNSIASKRSYHRRTLEYNENGVCLAEPFKVFEWREKKSINHITVKLFLDNGMYYYAYDYWFKNSGSGCGLWIGAPCFPSIEIALRHAEKRLIKIGAPQKYTEKLLLPVIKPEPVQKELF